MYGKSNSEIDCLYLSSIYNRGHSITIVYYYAAEVLVFVLSKGYSERGMFMIFKEINEVNRIDVNRFIHENWHSTDMVLRGKITDMTLVNGIIVYESNIIIGLITYEIINRECEILSLDSKQENKGIGTELVNRVIEIARSNNCNKIKLITTNDNINAIKFYQRRGFDMVRINHNALNISRQLKPTIPLYGEFGIPLMHEIEFEMMIEKKE